MHRISSAPMKTAGTTFAPKRHRRPGPDTNGPPCTRTVNRGPHTRRDSSRSPHRQWASGSVRWAAIVGHSHVHGAWQQGRGRHARHRTAVQIGCRRSSVRVTGPTEPAGQPRRRQEASSKNHNARAAVDRTVGRKKRADFGEWHVGECGIAAVPVVLPVLCDGDRYFAAGLRYRAFHCLNDGNEGCRAAQRSFIDAEQREVAAGHHIAVPPDRCQCRRPRPRIRRRHRRNRRVERDRGQR
ncbi:unnamed protein product, partial [Phaeothamnion confervicola]